MQGGAVTCCQLADEEIVDQEPHQFDCDTCEVASRLGDLDQENRDAWSLYQACMNRFLVDLEAGGLLLARLTEADDPEAFAVKCHRLRVLYNVLQPPKTQT